MGIIVCTLFDSKHLDYGIECCKSILPFCDCDGVYALCLDDTSFYTASTIAGVNAVDLCCIESDHAALLRVRNNRTHAGYCATVKPFFVQYMLDNVCSDKIILVDSDVIFFSSPKIVEDEIGSSHVMVTSRRQVPAPVQGNINGGFFACDNSPQSMEFVQWWQNRVVEWCEWDSSKRGFFAEEGYLKVIDECPWAFPGCKITDHPGINTAWWSISELSVDKTDDGFVIDGRWPLVNMHYQGRYRPKTDGPVINEIYDAFIGTRKNK